MDELTQYLKLCYYQQIILEQILDKKIIITKDHIDNININNCYLYGINIIKIFEKYGYVFTNDDYVMLVNKYEFAIKYILNDKQTDEICEIAVQKYGLILQYISEDKQTDKICKLAVQQDGLALQCVFDDKKTIEICEIAVRQNGNALKFVPEDKKTDEICKIAIRQNKYALHYVPNNKKYLFIKNENHNI